MFKHKTVTWEEIQWVYSIDEEDFVIEDDRQEFIYELYKLVKNNVDKIKRQMDQTMYYKAIKDEEDRINLIEFNEKVARLRADGNDEEADELVYEWNYVPDNYDQDELPYEDIQWDEHEYKQRIERFNEHIKYLKESNQDDIADNLLERWNRFHNGGSAHNYDNLTLDNIDDYDIDVYDDYEYEDEELITGVGYNLRYHTYGRVDIVRSSEIQNPYDSQYESLKNNLIKEFNNYWVIQSIKIDPLGPKSALKC